MNAMLGSGIITLIREFHANETTEKYNREISLKLPYTVAFTVNIGVAPLLFLQVLYGHFIYTSSILMAVYWICVIPVLILAYYSAYIYDFKYEALGEARKIFIAICVILLLWTGLMFSSNMVLMIQPELWTVYFNNPFGTFLNLSDPMVLPRFLHFVFASIALGGLFQAIIWKIKTRGKDAAAIKSGLNWFSGATGIQFVVGIWFLLSLPKDKMLLFMGESTAATFVLVLGIAAAVASMASAGRAKVWMTTGLAIGTVSVMTIARDILRSAYLKPYFSLSDLKIVPEYSPMVLFLVSFAAGIGIIIYMVKIAVSGKEA